MAQRLSIHSSAAAAAIPPLTLHQMQQTAKVQNATLVEYSIICNNFKVQGKQQAHEDQLYIWVIKPTGEVTFRQTDLRPLWQEQHITLDQLVNLPAFEAMLSLRASDRFSKR